MANGLEPTGFHFMYSNSLVSGRTQVISGALLSPTLTQFTVPNTYLTMMSNNILEVSLLCFNFVYALKPKQTHVHDSR